MSSAMQTVLDIPELFVLILLQCDIRTLLTGARRVSHLWCDVIDSTPAIQKALFFRPDYSSKPTLNPILVETFSLFFDGQVHDQESFDELPIGDENAMAEAFSLFFDGIVTDESSPRDAFMRKGASWRRMLVRQPPVRTMGYLNREMEGDDTLVFWKITVSDFREEYEGYPPMRNEIGPAMRDLNLTMGMLYDYTVLSCYESICRFTFFWNPERQASFAFADGPGDPMVLYHKDMTTPGEDRLVSDLAKDFDLIMGIKFARDGGVRFDFEKRFKWLQIPKDPFTPPW
ncbi:hypothetical protein F4679DRAFT_593199 [Xylaria curta]|nr:hypothetical protein F4679DRAFT_593199 [Xylaria curta]